MARITGNLMICKRILDFLIFSFLRIIFRTFQLIWWKFNGTKKIMKETSLPENYKHCVHVLNIVWWNKFDMFQTSSLSDYIYVHERFESPQYIFDNDHVTLFMINKDFVVFSEAKERGMLLWKMKFGSFLREAHVWHTKKLLVVPMVPLRPGAEELGDPKKKLIFLFNTGRCGSTLLAQMFEQTGQIACFSEPGSITELASLLKQEADTKEIRQLAKDIIRWTCRPLNDPTQPLMGYFIKFISPAMTSVSLFADIFPEAILLFMYRDVLKVAQSSFKGSREYPTVRLMFALGKRSAMATTYFMNTLGFHGADYNVRLFDDLTPGVFNYILTANYYIHLRYRGVQIAGIRYEDLVSDPIFASRRILSYCELPEKLAKLCVNGMKSDSQANSCLSMNNLEKYKNPELTHESKAYHNKFLKKFNLPLIGEDSLLEGTITSKMNSYSM